MSLNDKNLHTQAVEGCHYFEIAKESMRQNWNSREVNGVCVGGGGGEGVEQKKLHTLYIYSHLL